MEFIEQIISEPRWQCTLALAGFIAGFYFSVNDKPMEREL